MKKIVTGAVVLLVIVTVGSGLIIRRMFKDKF